MAVHRWDIHDSADLRSRHQHQAHASSDIGELSSLSKISERVVLYQLQNFISQSDPPILPPEQFACRHGHSCEDLLSKNINDWHVALDAGTVVGVVMLDMSKAFDCVSYELLLLELQSCGIGGAALVWFASYLHGRISRVQTSHAPPGEEFEATRGVPQGSVLEPLLFSLYVRTLPSVLRNSLLSQDVARVQSCMSERGLVLNHSKTEFLFPHKRTQAVARPTLNLNDGAIIRPATSVRYLGEVIGQHLIFSQQIASLWCKVAAKLKAFRRVRHLFTSGARRSSYLCFIQSVLEYMGPTRMFIISSSMNMTS